VHALTSDVVTMVVVAVIVVVAGMDGAMEGDGEGGELEGWEGVNTCGELAAFCQPKRLLAANRKCLFHAIKRLCVLRSNASLCMQANLLPLTCIHGTVHLLTE
jgi:hypothetical protein